MNAIARFLMLLPLAACGAPVQAPVLVEQDPASDFGAVIDHPYFPVQPGTVWYYEGEDDGEPLYEEVAALDPVAWFDGQLCLPLQQRRFLSATLVEVTTEWFAQDAVGNVWQYGEDSFVVEAGQLVATRDSWRAGVGGALAVLLFPAAPGVGDVTVLDLPHGQESYEVVAVDAVASTPAGTFGECLERHENPGDPDQDILLYAPGTGLAEVRAANGYKLLVAVQRPR